MTGRAEQDGLVPERDRVLALREHPLGHAAGLVGFVADADQHRAVANDAVGAQVFREALAGEPDHRVGCVEDRPRRAIVALERHDARGRIELRRKVEDVAHGRGAEAVDRLGVVTDDGHAKAVGLEAAQDSRLQAIRVLVLVDQNVIEAPADLRTDRRLVHHCRPVEQQVVVVEHELRLLGGDIRVEQRLQLGFAARTPREDLAKHVRQRCLAVDDAAVDRHAGRAPGKARSWRYRCDAPGEQGPSDPRNRRGRGS